MPVSRQRHECGICHQVYSTSSHLRRHQAKHVSREHFICQFCEQSFMRRDVLRRHYQSCRQKGSKPTPREGKRGRKRKACDACVESRTQCDGELPCEACLHRGVNCSLSHIGEQDWKSRGDQAAPKKAEDASINKIPVEFLLNYTDPASKTLYDVQRILAGCDKSLGEYAFSEECQMPNSDGSTEQWMGLFHLFVNTSVFDKSDYDQCLMYGLDDTEELSNTVSRIIGLLKYSPESQFNSKTHPVIEEAGRFFSPKNLTAFVNAFFEHSYKSTRFIHKASFNVHTSSPQLLLAIALMGATCLSPQDASSAAVYSNVAEYLIFEGHDFGQVLNTENPSLTKANMEILQAAMLVTVIQGWKDNISIKRRIRTQRFPALVCAARALRLTQATNDAVSGTEPLEWDKYFQSESVVRAMAWLYIMDSHSVVYYRNPPHFNIAEACFGLPQDEELYDSMEPSAWANGSRNAANDGLTLTLKSVIQRLMKTDDGPFEELLSQPCTLFGQFLVLGSLHCVLFDLQALGTCVELSGPLASIDVALDRWKKMWDLSYTTVKPGDIEQSGFMAHALEIWWLAKKLIQNPTEICPETGFAADSMSTFHQMIKKLKGFHPIQ